MYNNIQALRGIAALMVVMFHLLPQFKAMGLNNYLYESFARFGYIGVDIFFVISGFVMAKSTNKLSHDSKNARNFLSKRFARIFLGYWPAFFLALLLYSIFNANFLPQKDILSSFFLLSTNLSKLVIGPSWSLTYELYFYSLIALLLLFKKALTKFFLLALSVLIIVKIIFITAPVAWIDFFFSHFLLEFVLGYFLFHLKNYLLNPVVLYVLGIIGVSALVTGVNIKIADDWTRVASFGVFAFCLMACLLYLEEIKNISHKGVFKKLGDASYSLYIYHILFVNLFYHTGLRAKLVQYNAATIGFITYLLFIIIISLAIYRNIERPLYTIATKKY